MITRVPLFRTPFRRFDGPFAGGYNRCIPLLINRGRLMTGPSPPLPDPDESFSDRSLLRRFRAGQEDAATQLYLRYAGRLLALAQAQCAPDLAPRVDPEDIVQSVFRTFFRRAAQGHYEVPEGEELWKLFLVIGLNKIRATATFHRAAKRDVGVTASGEAF